MYLDIIVFNKTSNVFSKKHDLKIETRKACHCQKEDVKITETLSAISVENFSTKSTSNNGFCSALVSCIFQD